MNLKEMRAAALVEAKAALARMEADPSAENLESASQAAAEVKRLDQMIAESNEVTATIMGLKELAVPAEDAATTRPETLGDHFVKMAGKRLAQLKGGRATVSTPDFKDPGTIMTEGPQGPMEPVLTVVDRTIVQAFRRPTITSLFGQSGLDGQAIKYPVEGPREGDFGTVAEGGKLPQLQYGLPVWVTDTLSKIGGFIRLSDEMLEDLDFLVGEINTRLVYDYALTEEGQVLSGDGTGTNLLGLLNRDGVQTSTATNASLADEIFRSKTKISNASGYEPDALVINPVDYETLRLAKDNNGQYYGGGYFSGQYGLGGIVEQPPVWGLRTVVTPAVAVGAPVVGAFKRAATVYTKGGLWIEATNSNEDDFLHGLVTVRATKRIALAVRRPAAFVKIAVS